jgi:hypothetical protein
MRRAHTEAITAVATYIRSRMARSREIPARVQSEKGGPQSAQAIGRGT